jgi:hypothetical protein
MRLVLTTADLDRMPRSLRRNLMSWLALRQTEAGSAAEMAGAAAESDAAALGWEQAVALVRNVSFGRRNRPVHDLLEALSAAGTEGISGESLRTRLRLKDARQVRRLIDWATQLVQLVTHDERARLAQHSSDADVYSLHPITRENLHAIFARLGRSARGEAPLWE